MRQHSLVGPLLLIGVGALFLAYNLVPDVPLLDYLAQYWPFLLVLWGSLRLLEIGTWAIRGRPLPPYGLHGGEWVLVVFLCLLGTGLHAVRGFRSWLPQAGIEFGKWEIFGVSYDYPEEAEVTLASTTPRVVMEGFRGSARIVGVDESAVKVSGHRTIRAMDQRTADRASENVNVEVRAEGDRVTILLPRSETKGAFDHGISHDVDITVPRGSTLILNGRNGSLDVRNVNGTVEVSGDNTSVRMEEIGGNVRVDVNGSDLVRAVNVKGGVELQGRGSDIEFENISGPVNAGGSWSGLMQWRGLAQPVRWQGLYTTLSAAAVPGELRGTTGDIQAMGVTGPLRIESQNKDLSLTDVTGLTSISLARGDVFLRATTVPISDVMIRSQSGDVEMEFPDGARFNLDAATARGEAYNGYGTGITEDRTGRGASMRSTGGGATIDVLVTRGDISLRAGLPAGAATSTTPKQPLRRLPAEAEDQ